MRKYRVAVLTSHPIQYQVPLWRKLARHPQIDLMVYYCSDYGLKERFDPGFGIKFKWDIPLLDGYRYKFLRNYSPKRNLKGFWALVNLEIVREIWAGGYHVLFVHSYAYATHILALLAARLKGTRVAIRSDRNLLMKCSWRRRLLKRLILPYLFRTVNYFMAIGKLNREYYLHYGVPETKIYQTPYAVDNEWFFAQKDLLGCKEKLKEDLGIASDAKVILYVAKFLECKRPMDLIRAFEQLKLDNVLLVMVGDGQERRICENYVKTRRMQDVLFAGFKNQQELPRFYALADVFVLPSDDETWGLVLNEAMCFGCPIITTDQVGGAYDLIKHGVDGFVYRAGDIEALIGYFETLLKDDELREKMGKASLKKIEMWGLKENVVGLITAFESKLELP